MSTSPLKLSIGQMTPNSNNYGKSGSFIVNERVSSPGYPNIAPFIHHGYSKSQTLGRNSGYFDNNKIEEILSPRNFVIDEAHLQDLDYIHDKLHIFQNEIERLNKVNDKLHKDLDQSKFLVSQLGQREVELQPKLAALLAENDRLNRSLQEMTNLKIPAENRIRELSQELQEWRNKCLEYEPERNLIQAQLKALIEEKNTSKAQEFLIYTENQVLKERLIGLAGEVSNARKNLDREIESKYTDLLRKKQTENEELRKQLTDLNDRASNQAFQIHNQTLENSRIKESNSRLQARVSNLEKEALELRKNNTDLIVKSEDLVIKNNMLESDMFTINTILNSRTSDLGEAKRQLENYKEKFDMISDSREVLIDESIRMRRVGDLDKLDSDRKVLSYDAKSKRLSDENDELKRRLTALEYVNNLRLELENQIKILIRENGQLKEQINQYNRDSTLTNNKPTSPYNVEFEDMKYKYNAMVQENARLNAELSKKIAELEALKTQANQLQLDANIANNKANRLEEDLAIAKGDASNTEQKLSKAKSDFNDLKNQFNMLTGENMKLAQVNGDLMAENTNLNNRIAELEGGNAVINRLSMNMNDLLGEIQRLNKEVDDTNQKNQNLLEDNKNLFEALNELKSINEKNKKELFELKNQVVGLQNENNMLKGFISDLQDEKDRINEKVRDKIKNMIWSLEPNNKANSVVL